MGADCFIIFQGRVFAGPVPIDNFRKGSRARIPGRWAAGNGRAFGGSHGMNLSQNHYSESQVTKA